MISDKKYWSLPEEERKKIDAVDAKETEVIVERYYIWVFDRNYGWRQLDKMDGFNSLEELKKSTTYSHVSENKNEIFKITKSTIVEVK